MRLKCKAEKSFVAGLLGICSGLFLTGVMLVTLIFGFLNDGSVLVVAVVDEFLFEIFVLVLIIFFQLIAFKKYVYFNKVVQ